MERGGRLAGAELKGPVHPGAARRTVACFVGLVLAQAPGSGWAHTGGALEPAELWVSWGRDPWSLLAIGLAALVYARGTGRLWKRAGIGRGIPRWRFYCYVGGLSALFVALVSPLEALGGALFSAHMVQHEVLILIAAPLLVLGAPLVAFVWALPPGWRKRIGGWARTPRVRRPWRFLTAPLAAWTLHAVAVLVWHLPRPYQATLTSELAHALQHASFFATALLFWWAILQPSRHRRLSSGIAVFYLFTTAVYGSALGALLTFAPRPWYPAYAQSTAAWGLSPLEDQQLGGLVMWIPFGTIYTVAAVALLAIWLREIDRRNAPNAIGHTSTYRFVAPE
jgi:putative membrane protein